MLSEPSALAALSVFAPAVVPSVHRPSVAIPLTFVTTAPFGGDIVPPPAVTVKITVIAGIGLPNASRITTAGRVATAVPATAL
jgi:hypothetical protein